MLAVCLFVTLFLLVDPSSAFVSVTFDPTYVRNRTTEREQVLVRFISTNESDFTVDFKCRDAFNCEIVNSTYKIHLGPSNRFQFDTVFTVQGLYFGHTSLVYNSSIELRSDGLEITILRTKKDTKLSTVFTVIYSAVMMLNTFIMGTQLDIEVIKKCFKTPIGPSIGFCCQYICMPLIAFGWACVFLNGHPSLQFGFFAVGCAPGGGYSNFWTILLDGNIDLSVTMTFVSNVAAIAMLPFWLYSLGRVFFKGRITIPFPSVFQSLAMLVIPIGFGMLLVHYKPAIKHKFGKVLKIMLLSVILLSSPFFIYANLHLIPLLTVNTVICGMLLPWTGYAISYAVAYALKQTAQDCRTIAIETGIQNAPIAMLLCLLSLPEPDSDITLVMPLCVLFFTTIPLWCFLVIFTIRKRNQKAIKEQKSAQDLLEDF